MKRHLFTTTLISIGLLSAIPVLAAGIKNEAHKRGTIECLDCHTCEVPTLNEPCLKPCPSLSMTHITSEHKLSEAPDTIMLSQLAEQYRPVRFNHKYHAEMAVMGEDCATCHHYSPPGHIPPCRECHGGEGNPANLRQPSLKGAYHRQCLSCHREWSHDTKCVLCHLPAEGAVGSTMMLDTTDILGISHPVITEPTTKVYLTPYEEGPTVTFHHNEHIELFDLQCVNCHKQENCSYCHDIQKPTRFAKTDEQVHAICNDCHVDDACSKCHDTKERPGFTHATTGWALNRYHQALACRACHPTGRRIAQLDNRCIGCHAGWNQDNFNHAITGLMLDEIHIQLDCTDCHLERNYAGMPDCSNCHDDGRSPSDVPPGEMVKVE